MITINKYNIYCQIENLYDRNVLENLDGQLSYFVQGYEFSKGYRQGFWNPKTRSWDKWDGKKHLLDQYLRFPAGLCHYATSLFTRMNLEYSIVDKRKKPKLGKKIDIENFDLRYYQEDAIKNALNNEIGMIKIATGGGKSIVIAGLIAATNVKTIVYVPGLDLLDQTADVIEKALGIKVGRIGNGNIDIQKINVCTIQTAAMALGEKYEAYDEEDRIKEKVIKSEEKIELEFFIKNSDMLIFDECQILGAQTAQLISNASKNTYYKYGLSATNSREDGSDMLLEAVCGNTVIDISSSKLIKEDYLVKPTIHFIEVPELKEKLEKNYQTIYKEYIVENDVRNEKIASAAMKLFNSGRKTLILVKQISHGSKILEKLENQCNVSFVKGDIDLDERNQIKKDFIKGKIDIIIASTVFDVGIDLPALDALILAGSGKSKIRCIQRVGRAIRKAPNKKDAIIIDFIDNAEYLKKHSERRMEIYKSESEFKVLLPRVNGDNSVKTVSNPAKKETVKKKAKPVQKSKLSW